jgi:hypothetical protein
MYADSNAGSGMYEFNNNRKRNSPICIQAAPVCNKESTCKVEGKRYHQIKWKSKHIIRYVLLHGEDKQVLGGCIDINQSGYRAVIGYHFKN